MKRTEAALLRAFLKNAGVIDRIISRAAAAASKPVARGGSFPLDLLMGTKGTGRYQHARLRPRKSSLWEPVDEVEHLRLVAQGRGKEVARAHGQSIKKKKSFGGLAGVVQRNPGKATLVGGAAYLLGKSSPQQPSSQQQMMLPPGYTL